MRIAVVHNAVDDSDGPDARHVLLQVETVCAALDALGHPATCFNSIANLRKRGKHIQVGLMTGNHRHPKVPMDQVLADLQATVEQLPCHTRHHEANVLAEVLQHSASRKRGGIEIGALLPAVLARLGIGVNEITENDTTKSGDRP